MRLSAEAACLYLPRPPARHHADAARRHRPRGGSEPQPTRTQRASPSMAKRRVTGGRVRSLIAAVLVIFVVVTTGVIARRVRGVQEQRKILDLERQRDALDAERARLEAAIRDASSRARLQPIAEQRLNMHIATPEQQIILPRPAAAATATTRP